MAVRPEPVRSRAARWRLARFAGDAGVARRVRGLGTLRTLLVALLVAVLAGCAGTPESVDAVDDPMLAWERHLAWLDSLVGWEADGKVALRDADEAVSARVRWQQAADDTELLLSGVLGLGATRVRASRAGAELRTSSGDELRAPSADVLVAEAVGVAVPVAGLRYWLLGRPQPDHGVDRLELDAAGRLAQLEQDGWSLAFGDYVAVAERSLPTRITMSRADIRSKIVIKRWDVHGAG